MDISVVLVTCNRPAEVFMRAYRSVCSQTCRPKEFIVVNAGSSELPKLVGCTLIDAPGSNASIARNIGAKRVTSDFIAFLDDDDEWLPEHLESHLSCIGDGIGLIYSNRPEKGAWYKEETNIMVRNWIGPTSFVSVSRECFEKVGGFDETFVANQEWDLWMRLCLICKTTECPSATVIKHDSEDSISRNTKKRIAGWESILTKHEPEYKLHPEIFKKVIQVYMDEMHAKHSLKGTICARKWIKKIIT